MARTHGSLKRCACPIDFFPTKSQYTRIKMHCSSGNDLVHASAKLDRNRHTGRVRCRSVPYEISTEEARSMVGQGEATCSYRAGTVLRALVWYYRHAMSMPMGCYRQTMSMPMSCYRQTLSEPMSCSVSATSTPTTVSSALSCHSDKHFWSTGSFSDAMGNMITNPKPNRSFALSRNPRLNFSHRRKKL